LLGPGDVVGTSVGDWLLRYIEEGRAPARAGGAFITDARDVALGMLAAAERGVSGEFDVLGPFYTFGELVDVLLGTGPARTNLALPEFGINFRPVEETIKDAIAWLEASSETPAHAGGRTMVA
jgi:nucleoside-diphosphate-sugar epimerase